MKKIKDLATALAVYEEASIKHIEAIDKLANAKIANKYFKIQEQARTFIKKEEASELKDAIEELLNSEIGKSHSHISNASFDKEINIVLYNPEDDLRQYNLHEKLISHLEKNGKIED